MLFNTFLPFLTTLVVTGACQPASKKAPAAPGCGEVDVIFTGLPPFHPLVTAQGFNGSAVNAGLRQDAKDIIAAGYNLRVVLMGPEVPMSTFENQVKDGGYKWGVTGVGYGVRGSHLENITERFTDIVGYYRKAAPLAPMAFDYSFVTADWAIQRIMPLSENCTAANKPGKDLVSIHSSLEF